MKKRAQKAEPAGRGSMARVGENLWRNLSSGRYYALFKRNGKQIRRTLKTQDKDLAKRKLEELRGKVQALRRDAPKGLTFGQLADRWLESLKGGNLKHHSFRRREVAVNMLGKFFGAFEARAVTPHDCDTWKASRGPQISAQTFNIERETLRRIYAYAQREGLVLDSPARFLERRKRERTALVVPTREQFRKLVAQLRSNGVRSREAADLAEFLGYSGCRLGEAVGMVWGDVDFAKKVFVVTGGEEGTKNHEARHVPLFAPLERHLLAMRERLGKAPVAGDRLFSMETSKKALGTACRKAGLPHFTHHSLRHFFCSNAIEAGIDFKVIAGWLGHKDGGVLVAKTYGHLRDEHSAAMAQRMTFDVCRPSAGAAEGGDEGKFN